MSIKGWKAISLCDSAALLFQSNCLLQTVQRAVIKFIQNMTKEVMQWKNFCYHIRRASGHFLHHWALCLPIVLVRLLPLSLAVITSVSLDAESPCCSLWKK